jgi:hypothetical protein
LLQSRSGGRHLLLAGLGGEGKRVRLPGNHDVDDLLAGRGGEEEHSHVVTILSASWRVYLCCFWCGGSTSVLFLSTGHGGEGEDGKDAAASSRSKRRHKCVPKRCYGAVSSSSTLLLMRCSSRKAHQRGTYAGVIALPLLLMADWQPFSWRTDFPRTKLSKGKSHHFRHDAGPTGSSSAPVFVRRSNSMAISFCGAEHQGPDRFFQSFYKAVSVIFLALSRNPLNRRGLSAIYTHRLFNTSSF